MGEEGVLRSGPLLNIVSEAGGWGPFHTNKGKVDRARWPLWAALTPTLTLKSCLIY